MWTRFQTFTFKETNPSPLRQKSSVPGQPHWTCPKQTWKKRCQGAKLQGRSRDRVAEDRLVDAGGEEAGPDGSSTETSCHGSTDTHLARRARRALGMNYYGTGTSWGSHHLGGETEGRGLSGGATCPLIAGSSCWVAETSTTWKSNCLPIKNVKSQARAACPR